MRFLLSLCLLLLALPASAQQFTRQMLYQQNNASFFNNNYGYVTPKSVNNMFTNMIGNTGLLGDSNTWTGSNIFLGPTNIPAIASLGCESATVQGFVGDGSTDNVSAWTTWSTVHSGSACLHFTHGTYKFSTAISKTLASGNVALTIEGDGAEGTSLYWPNGSGGMTIVYNGPGNASHFRNIGFTTGQAGGGAGLTLTQAGACMLDFAATSLDHTRFAGSDQTGSGSTNYWTIANSILGVSGISWTDATITGPGSGAYGIGINVAGTGSGCYSLVLSVGIGTNIASVQNGIILNTYVQGVTINQTNIDNGAGPAVWIPTGAIGITQVAVSNSQFNQLTSHQLYIQAPIAGLLVSNNLIYVNTNYGGVVATGNNLADFSITGNNFSGNSLTGTSGIYIVGSYSGGVPGTITGNTFKTLGTGINLGAATNDIKVQGNSYGGNTTDINSPGSQPIYDAPGYMTTANLSSCGGSPSIDVFATDFGGQITEGTSASGCNVNWKTNRTVWPNCTVSSPSGGPTPTWSTNAVGLAFAHSTGSGYKYNYVCTP